MLLIKVWAISDTPPLSKHAEKRCLGEVRIPLQQLREQCNGMLYYTWVNLEREGLDDSLKQLGGSVRSVRVTGGHGATGPSSWMQEPSTSSIISLYSKKIYIK